MNILITLLVSGAAVSILLWRQKTVYKSLLRERDAAIEVVTEIRQNKMLYFKHPRFKLVQNHINKVLYPKER